MESSDIRYQEYVRILREELVPALGCTEPIAIAFAAACARRALKAEVAAIDVVVSNNIIKNVKSVVVPNTGGLRGIQAAAAVGALAGVAEKRLEVISSVTEEQQAQLRAFLETHPVTVRPSDREVVFEIIVTLTDEAGNTAQTQILDHHTNVTLVQYNGQVLYRPERICASKKLTNRDLLKVKDILEFAETVNLEEVREPLERQIACNTAISDEGLTNPWGANIGKTLMAMGGGDVKIRARARAAAGSDARMSGCDLPVIINSGSGNQGMTCSLPVIEYAQTLGVSHDTMLRALVLSNLITIHLKDGLGTLSAYCGAISAGCAAGSAIAWLHGGDFRAVAHTLVNALAIVSGIICDGAKASCAAKIAFAVEAGIFGWEMYQQGQQFYGGDGIVKKGVENTIRSISRLGSQGMRGTDDEIVRIMTEEL